MAAKIDPARIHAAAQKAQEKREHDRRVRNAAAMRLVHQAGNK